MKLRMFVAFTIVVALGLLLALVVVAQGEKGTDTELTPPRIVRSGGATENIAVQGSTGLSLGNTSPMTFTPEYTAYLPVVVRNYDPLRIFFDDFGNPNSGWFTGDTDDWTVAYLAGEYQILLKKTLWGWLITHDLSLPSDYRVEVDARQASSNAGAYGLMFGIRWGADTYEGYQVIVYPTTQEYLLEKRNWDGTWPLLIDWTYSSAIRQGMASNHLRVDRIGTAIYLYINGTQVTTFTDSSFTGSGRDAGVRAYSYQIAPVDVRFDNFGAYRTQ
jgi:hypothetical protein